MKFVKSVHSSSADLWSVVCTPSRLVRALTFFVCAGWCFVCSARFLLLFCARFTGRGADGNGVPGADLLSGDSELTELGKTFFDLYKDLQRCADDSLDSAMKGTPSPSSTSVPFAEIAGEFSFCRFIPIFITSCVHHGAPTTRGPTARDSVNLFCFEQRQQ